MFRQVLECGSPLPLSDERFMGSFNLQDRTPIEAMNLFVRRKPKRQRTGALQDLAEARKHLALTCARDSPVPVDGRDARPFLGSKPPRNCAASPLSSGDSSLQHHRFWII